MMVWYEYIVIAMAVFFAGGWALGLVLSPRNRTGGNILTVILWWIALALTLGGTIAPPHLLWIFPLALIVPALLLLSIGWALVIACLSHPAAAANRSRVVRSEFMRETPCPSTGKTRGACPGYVVDHIEPLCAGGSDDPRNMQWQTVSDAKAKDRDEVKQCRKLNRAADITSTHR